MITQTSYQGVIGDFWNDEHIRWGDGQRELRHAPHENRNSKIKRFKKSRSAPRRMRCATSL